MANIHFYLRSGQANKKGQQSLVMRVTHNYIRPNFFIGYMVHPKHWSQTNQKVKKQREDEPDNNYIAINERISLFKEKTEAAINRALRDEIPITEAFLKNALLGPAAKSKKVNRTFFEVLDEYIESSKAIRANRTIVCYGTFKNFLLDFERDTNSKVDLHAINFKFFDNLRTYAFVKRKARDNYFAKIISNLKAFLSWCQKRGYIKDMTYKEFKAAEREKDVIYLTLEELLVLYNFTFASPKRERARDLFCFMCFTGLRISDLKNLKKENIREGQIFKTIVKTHKTEVIPLNQFAQAILAKYEHLEHTPLPKLSSQKLNDHIKDCCEEAGIKSPVTYVDYSGGKAKEHTEAKYKLITNHTARKTFITNSIVLGMNTKTIKEITGHKKDSVFNKYIKISEDFKKLEMERTWDKISG
ncbi:MAG: site-specific integrase [Bacteroidales bacterium]|nr:site-specific integrase [Bacteroidales bacterium]